MAIKRPQRQGRKAFIALGAIALTGCLLLGSLWGPTQGSLVGNTVQTNQGSQAGDSSVGAAGSGGNTGSSSGKRGGGKGGGGSGSKKTRAANTAAAQPNPVTDEITKRCAGTLGTWCVDYWTQAEVPAVTAPRGNKTCSLNCNQVGTCSALTGRCTCSAGWTGFNCLHPMKRYCTHKYRENGFDVPRLEPDMAKGIGGPSPNMFPRGRCAGFCDEEYGACYCPSNTTYGRIPRRPEDPQGFPPARVGRTMDLWCQPNKMPDGTDTAWGSVTPDDLFGPEGWCTAEKPKIRCLCYRDGRAGEFCDEEVEQTCFSQCNGRGECLHGYCKCHTGWHGIDCAHRSADADESKPGLEVERPWIKEFVHTPAGQDFPAGVTRKRPLIFVYEMASDYATIMLQYRHGVENCIARSFGPGNTTRTTQEWVYMAEAGFLEQLLQSMHRTLDPEEADFYYVPVLVGCFQYPVRDTQDSLIDFYYHVSANRAQSSVYLILEAYHWIRGHFPYWDRRGGRDHIWFLTHDEGSCLAPAAIKSSIILSHWGRMDANHTSGTAYGSDNYSQNYSHPQFEPKSFQDKMAHGVPCYEPEKDLVMPLMKRPDHYQLSPLIGGPARNRTWLAMHRGRVQFEVPNYSRGLRQRLANASLAGGWMEKHKIAVGEQDAIEGSYSELLASSVFCLVVPGDGWSARMDDAMLHGCIPVPIMDEVHVSFESIIEFSAIGVRVAQKDVERLPEILLAVTEKRRAEMQRNIARVWQRHAYSGYRGFRRRFLELQAQYRQAAEAAANATQEEGVPAGGARRQLSASKASASLPETVPDLDPEADDAFTTAMGWLYSRIEATR